MRPIIRVSGRVSQQQSGFGTASDQPSRWSDWLLASHGRFSSRMPAKRNAMKTMATPFNQAYLTAVQLGAYKAIGGSGTHGLSEYGRQAHTHADHPGRALAAC